MMNYLKTVVHVPLVFAMVEFDSRYGKQRVVEKNYLEHFAGEQIADVQIADAQIAGLQVALAEIAGMHDNPVQLDE